MKISCPAIRDKREFPLSLPTAIVWVKKAARKAGNLPILELVEPCRTFNPTHVLGMLKVSNYCAETSDRRRVAEMQEVAGGFILYLYATVES